MEGFQIGLGHKYCVEKALIFHSRTTIIDFVLSGAKCDTIGLDGKICMEISVCWKKGRQTDSDTAANLAH